jgi:hypothetical protein
MPVVEREGCLFSQPIFDTVEAAIGAAGAVVMNFFAVPQGGIVTGVIPKNRRHTNLTQAGRLETGNSLVIKAISLHFPITAEAGALATIADISAIRAGAFRLMFGGDTVFCQGQIAELPCGGLSPVYLNDAALAVPVNYVYQPGVSVVQNKYFLEYPLTLHPQESVRLTFDNMDAIVALTLASVHLWGDMLRPVR